MFVMGCSIIILSVGQWVFRAMCIKLVGDGHFPSEDLRLKTELARWQEQCDTTTESYDH